MAAVTHLITTAATTAANPTFSTGSFTPAAGDLLVAFVVATATTATGSMTDSQGLGFSKAGSCVYAGTINTIYAFISDALAAATPMTVTFDCTGDASSGQAVVVYGVSGMSQVGLAARRQYDVVSNQSAGTTPTVALSLFGFPGVLTGNPTLGCVGNGTSPATVTPPTGWTEPTGVPNAGTGTNGDTGYSTPTTGCETCFRDSGFTGNTLTWASTSGSAYGALAIELDASAAPTFMPSFTKPILQAVNRASTY